MLFVCYKKCTTCKGVQKLMDQKSLDYKIRDIKEDNPSKEELCLWLEKSGLDIGKFYNTSGVLYREMNLKDKRKTMSLEDQLDLLARDGMLVKRPILIMEDQVLVGPMVKKYLESL